MAPQVKLWWPFRRWKGDPDPEAFYEELAKSQRGRQQSQMDRYLTFRSVFMSSDEGRRVLFEILSWCHVFKSSAMLANLNPKKTLFHEGERNIALKLQAVLRYEPTSTKPEEANRRAPDR